MGNNPKQFAEFLRKEGKDEASKDQRRRFFP
jgi:hypothetical protein